MNTSKEVDQRKGIYYGWWIVIAGFIIAAFGLGAQSYTMSQLVNLVRDQFHGGAEVFGLAMAIPGLAGGVALLASGPLIDNNGPRRLMLIGIPMAGLGLLGLGIINSLFLVYILGALIGIGLSIGFLLPIQTATANWYIKRRSLALAIISCASFLGAHVMYFLQQRPSDQSSVQGTFVALGLLMLLICGPLALLIRQRPEQYGLLPDGAKKDPDKGIQAIDTQKTSRREIRETLWWALKTRSFWLLFVATALSSGISSLASRSAFSVLLDRGFAPNAAAQASSLAPFSGLIGILIFGCLGDFFPKRYLLALVVAIHSLSAFIMFTADSISQLQVYSAVSSLSYGTVPLLLAITADYFGRRVFATITVAMGLFVTIGEILVNALSGNIDRSIETSTGSAETTFLIAMLLGLIPAALFYFAKPPRPVEQHLP